MKQCILVVGMHRSGTSVMAGTLKIMGVDFGDKLCGPDVNNVKGYFEHTGIHEVNDCLLQAFGSSWKDIKPLPENWLSDSRVTSYKEQIHAVIARDFTDSELFGIKDPRLSILLPLYLDILNAMSVQPLFVIVERPVVEVAESLYKRDKMANEQSLSLWRKYNDAINTFTSGEGPARVEFAELLRDPRRTLTNIQVALGISLRDFNLVRNEVYDFIDPKLKHFDVDKPTWMTFKNRATKAIDYILPLHTRRRQFVKSLVCKREVTLALAACNFFICNPSSDYGL
jgi:hypothetical protein